jgi:hypothetical protein
MSVANSDEAKRPLIGPMSCFIAAIGAVVLGLLFQFRALPFLRDEMILSTGKLYPTGPWAAAMAKFFYCGAGAFVTIGILGIIILTDANRRYIARLPKRQRFLIWPWVKLPDHASKT